jgi:hypothetical protein
MLLFLHKTMLCLSLLLFVLSGVHVLLMLLFLFWLWYCLSFHLRILITGTPSLSSNFPHEYAWTACPCNRSLTTTPNNEY